jgi:phage terminase small subunit
MLPKEALLKLCNQVKKLKQSILRQFSPWDDAKLLILETLIEKRQLVIECRARIEKDGLVVPGERGACRQHPLLNVLRDATSQYLNAAKLLGLNLDEESKKPGHPTQWEQWARRKE